MLTGPVKVRANKTPQASLKMMMLPHPREMQHGTNRSQNTALADRSNTRKISTACLLRS